MMITHQLQRRDESLVVDVAVINARRTRKSLVETTITSPTVMTTTNPSGLIYISSFLPQCLLDSD
jgi:hypothetical protein